MDEKNNDKLVQNNSFNDTNIDSPFDQVPSSNAYEDKLSDYDHIDIFSQKPSPLKRDISEDEDIEILSLEEDYDTKKKLINHGISSENRKVKTSESTTNKAVMFLMILGAFIVIWYTAFAQPLAYNNRQLIAKSGNKDGDNGTWDIRFVDMNKKNVIGPVVELSSPSYTSTKASFYVSLKNPGDEISYDITIKNGGTIDAKVSDIIIDPVIQADDPILYSVNNIGIGDELNAGDSTVMTVTVKYNPERAITTSSIVKNITILINYVQK